MGIERLDQINDDLQILEEVDESDTDTTNLIPIIEAECDRLQSEFASIAIELELPDDIEITADESLKYLIRRMLESLSIRYSDTLENTHIDITVTQTPSEVSVVARSRGHQIPELEVSALQAREERPLNHALGVDLWVLKWLANRYGGDVDFRVTSEDTIISISLQSDTPLEQLVKDVTQPLSIKIGELRH